MARSAWVDRRVSRLIDAALRRFTDLDVRDYASLLHLSDEYGVIELVVERDDWLTGRTLEELERWEEGLLVLGVYRSDGAYVGAPRGATTVHPDDMLILYGRSSRLDELDRRSSGLGGDRAHHAAVAEQDRIERGEEGEGKREGDPPLGAP